MIKTCSVQLDPITAELAQAFDYEFTGESSFEVPRFSPPSDFSVGLIVGNSGSGKSLLLEECFGGESPEPRWEPTLSIAGHFKDFNTACEKLFAVGISSVPTMCKPFHVLSNGEKYRAKMARVLESGCRVDEYTSVVDRSVAKGISVALRKYVRKQNLRNIVLCSCHFDIIEWLEPDWVFDLNSRDFIINEFSINDFPKLGEFIIS
jgi:hypothetical protein